MQDCGDFLYSVVEEMVRRKCAHAAVCKKFSKCRLKWWKLVKSGNGQHMTLGDDFYYLVAEMDSLHRGLKI